jgi:hypothetical protein
MSGGPDQPAPANGAREPGEVTVELELTAAQHIELSRAAEAAVPRGDKAPSKAGYGTVLCRRTGRMDLLATATFAALILGTTAVAGWRALIVAPTTPVVAISVPRALARANIARPSRPVVQMINPFDATEVFELPADTTETEARNAIAELLLQRARERFRQGVDLRRASNRHPTSVASAGPSDVFVTRLSDLTNRFADGSGLRADSGAVE